MIYKIGDAPPFIANAARRFLGQQPKMESQVYNVFEGHLRSIIGSMTMEEIIRERDKLGSQVRSASGVEMEKLGLVVDSLQIKDLQDPTGYIQNIAKPHIAQVKMEARIAEATRNREAAEKEAEAAALIADAQSVSAIRQSVAQANAERAKANAAQAGPLADATARQQVVVQETEVAKLEADREEQKLQTTIRKPADAKAYAKRTDAEGQKAADISAAEALARRTELEAQVNARRTELQAQANATAAAAAAGATKVTGEAEAAATKASGDAAASAIKAKAAGRGGRHQGTGRGAGDQPGRGYFAAARREHAGHHRCSGRAVLARGPDDGAQRRRRRQQDARRNPRPGWRLPSCPLLGTEEQPGRQAARESPGCIRTLTGASPARSGG